MSSTSCEECQNGFVDYAPLKLTILRNGSDILVYAENNSRNIIRIKCMILCYETEAGAGFIYRRKEDFVISDEIEQYLTYLMFSLALPNVSRVQVEAEYMEFSVRATSGCLVI